MRAELATRVLARKLQMLPTEESRLPRNSGASPARRCGAPRRQSRSAPLSRGATRSRQVFCVHIEKEPNATHEGISPAGRRKLAREERPAQLSLSDAKQAPKPALGATSACSAPAVAARFTMSRASGRYDGVRGAFELSGNTAASW